MPQPQLESASVREAVAWARAELTTADVPSARVDAELLLAYARGLTRAELVRAALMNEPAWLEGNEGATQRTKFLDALARRIAREPLQHITGRAFFRYLELEVGPGVFTPRPETESVTQVAIDELVGTPENPGRAVLAAAGQTRPIVVDLCTGSGAIALAIATELPTTTVYGVELSSDAFAWTQRNNARYEDPVTLVRADGRTALEHLNGQVDVVISNPPYVPPNAVPKDPEVAHHDPEIALYGLGPDGLEVPRGITRAAARLLRPGGLYVMEHAEVQGPAAIDMVTATGLFDRVETRVDLTNRPRMVVAYRNSSAFLEGSSL